VVDTAANLTYFRIIHVYFVLGALEFGSYGVVDTCYGFAPSCFTYMDRSFQTLHTA